MPCACGRERVIVKQDVATFYKDKKIKVIDVPVFICDQDHISMARKVRKYLRILLKEAYELELDEIGFYTYSDDNT